MAMRHGIPTFPPMIRPYPDDKDAAGEVASGLFTAFSADTPDEKRFVQGTCVPVLKIEGNCSAHCALCSLDMLVRSSAVTDIWTSTHS